MPRPIFRNQQQQQTSAALSTRPQASQTRSRMDPAKLDLILRRKRSQAYMDALKRLDAGGHVHNRQQMEEIINAIRAEFPEVSLEGILLGFVDKCYLGAPYEVHTIDLSGGIIEHFKRGQILPNGMEKARTLAMSGSYQFIEVYTNCLRAVSSNGSVSVIPC